MLKEFACRDVGIDCDYKVRGETEDEIFKNAEEHGKERHGLKGLTDDLKMKIRQVLHDVPSEQHAETKIA